MKINKNKLSVFLLMLMLPACTKFVQVDTPSTQLITSTVFTSDNTATAAVTGIYANMMTVNLGFYGGGITLAGGLSADEFQNFSFTPDQSGFADNSLKPTNQVIKQLWGEPYQYIYAANAIIQGLTGSTGVSSTTARELEGEAKFIRAFSYFYLVNLWGDVPLVLQTTYTTNDTLSRTPVPLVYKQIIADLQDAESLLLPDYTTGGGERIRPNQSAATALLARVFLYTHDWQGAINQATTIIGNTGLYSLQTDLSQVFLANSAEAIWQLQPVTPEVNTWEGNYFILTAGPSSSPAQITLSNTLVSSFEPGDLRKSNWTNIDTTGGLMSYYPYKYKVQFGSPVTEYEMMLRFSEQYLIRSEAEANLGDITSAVADLNIIRQRAGLPGLSTSLSQNACLQSIAQERKIELFAEWGHRWLDLKRTGMSGQVLSPEKPGWMAYDSLYPLPQSEIQNDPHLTQNAGY
jgi:starch-binding outer membrane protein, SusD/RagB family